MGAISLVKEHNTTRERPIFYRDKFRDTRFRFKLIDECLLLFLFFFFFKKNKQKNLVDIIFFKESSLKVLSCSTHAASPLKVAYYSLFSILNVVF